MSQDALGGPRRSEEFLGSPKEVLGGPRRSQEVLGGLRRSQDVSWEGGPSRP